MDEYRVRRTLFEKESAFRVQDGVLIRSLDGVEQQRVVLAEVRKVALSYQPALFDRWVCSVKTPGGRIWLPSASYTGFGQATDRRATFRPFVETLCQTVGAQPGAASIEFVKGNNWSAYGSLVLVILLAIMGVLLVFGILGSLMEGGGIGGAAWAFLPITVVVWSSGMVWRIWRLNRRHRFDPKAFPPDFAPLR